MRTSRGLSRPTVGATRVEPEGRCAKMGVVGSLSRHLSIGIDRPVAEVYGFAADPANLPRWAAGLAGSTLERDGDQWFTQSPMGRVAIRFTPRNDLGVLDHDVTLPSGETVYNPVRVIADGARSEVVFTLRQRPGMTDRDFERDADAVAADLSALKSLIESD